ncbi:MAG: xanthine phosphoribosyltransferase [Erysipelotrichaceae bacterium]|nr:xanthine phosphoribosyltransferase [Erysipelotrichaceae bacterium]
MNKLTEKIKNEGRILPGEVLKVDGFLNHLVDIELLEWIGNEFYERFKDEKVTKVMTLEASGIPPAVMTAYKFKAPLIFAKKAKSSNLGDQNLYIAHVKSYTYGNEFAVTAVKDYISKDDRILIIDDFLARGEAGRGMIDICKQAGATVAGIGICIEKSFQPGGRQLREEGYHVESLAIVSMMNDEGEIEFEDDTK